MIKYNILFIWHLKQNAKCIFSLCNYQVTSQFIFIRRITYTLIMLSCLCTEVNLCQAVYNVYSNSWQSIFYVCNTVIFSRCRSMFLLPKRLGALHVTKVFSYVLLIFIFFPEVFSFGEFSIFSHCWLFIALKH